MEKVDWTTICWKDFQLDEWHFGTKASLTVQNEFPFEGDYFSAITFSIPVARKTSFYVNNVLWLMYFLNMITWTVFLIAPDDIADRISVTITIFLSELAFNLIISGVLPRVSYNTWFSIYFLINYLCLALQSIEHVASYLISQHANDGENRGQYLDWAFVISYAILHTCMAIFCTILSRHHNKKHKKAIDQENKDLNKSEEVATESLMLVDSKKSE